MRYENYLQNAVKEFRRYKSLGDRTLERLNNEAIHWRPNEESNSIAIIVKHMAGNMHSRWTNFLTEDGEKSWRERDAEFEDSFSDKGEMIAAWEKGWDTVFSALGEIDADNFDRPVFIRAEKHSIVEAVNRQLGHYAYHTGQIVMLAKMVLGEDWQSLTIPKGKSDEFNASMFKKKQSGQL